MRMHRQNTSDLCAVVPYLNCILLLLFVNLLPTCVVCVDLWECAFLACLEFICCLMLLLFFVIFIEFWTCFRSVHHNTILLFLVRFGSGPVKSFLFWVFSLFVIYFINISILQLVVEFRPLKAIHCNVYDILLYFACSLSHCLSHSRSLSRTRIVLYVDHCSCTCNFSSFFLFAATWMCPYLCVNVSELNKTKISLFLSLVFFFLI